MSPFGPKRKQPDPKPNRPSPPMPPTEPGCTCEPWKFVNGHWTRVHNGSCPVHGEDE